MHGMYSTNNACKKDQNSTKTSMIYSQETSPFIGYSAKNNNNNTRDMVIKPLGNLEEKFRSKEIHGSSVKWGGGRACP